MKNNRLSFVIILVLFPSYLFSSSVRCPEGCYSCTFKEDEGKEDQKISLSLIRKKIKEGTKLECQGCWHDRLGAPGCPPLRIKQERCLLYYKTGICVVCEKGYIPRTFNDNGYLNSRCVESKEKSVVWGFYDHTTQSEFMRVCEGKFPVYQNKYCRPFQEGDFISKSCLWGSGHRGCMKCFRCKKGFTSYYGVCRPTSRSLRGCVYASDDDFCDYCDHWDGFFMDYPGHCAEYRKIKKTGGALKKCVNDFLRFKNRVFMAYEMFN